MRVLYVSTISNTINAFLMPHIELLIDHGYEVDVACNIDRKIDVRLTKRNCKVFDIEFYRSPLSKQNYLAYKKLKKLIQDEQYDLVHTHTPVASVCVRLACMSMKNVKVIYTAHGFHFFKGAPLINWLLYYPIECWLARYTDVLITINNEDYASAKNSLKAKRIEYIPGVGLDTNHFGVSIDDKIAKLKEWGVPDGTTTLLSVGELNKNKNHETIIRAVSKLNDSSIYYVICGKGPRENKLKELAKKLGIEKQVKFLGFRNDMEDIYSVANIFVFPSFREGLSVALMEAMASGLPVVCSDIRGNRDLIEDGKGGYLCEPNDVDGFANVISKFVEDKSLRKAKGFSNLETIKKYDVKIVKLEMERIYSDSLL